MRDLISKLFGKSRPGSPEDGASQGVQPARIHLVRDRDLEWAHRAQVAARVRDLRRVGYETITSFRIAEIEGLHLVGLAHRQAGYLAVVYEHRLAGVWCNLVAVYESGETLTVSNARQGRTLEPMPGHEKHLLRGASVAALYKSFKRHLRGSPRLRIVPGNFVQVFEDAYAREVAWRAAPAAEMPPAAAVPAAGAPLADREIPAPAPAAERIPVPAPASEWAPTGEVAAAAVANEPTASEPAANEEIASRIAAAEAEADRAALDRQCAPLFAAIAARNRAQVRELIDRGLPVEGRDAFGRTALVAAVASGDPQLVETLLAASADPNSRTVGMPGDALGVETATTGVITPLTAAIETGDADIVTLLLASGADLSGPEELTPLQFAAQQGDADVLAALLAASAEVDQPGEDGYTPLLSAAAEGYLDVAEILVMAGANVDFRCDGETAITLAAAAGAADIVEYLAPRVKVRARRRAEKLLTEAGPTVDTQAKRLMQAAMNGKAVMVGKLLGNGVHPDAVEQREEGEKPATPLMVATQEGHLEVMRILIRAGADVDYADAFGTPLKRALNPTFMDAEKQPAVIRLLIESGADFERLEDDERQLMARALKGV